MKKIHSIFERLILGNHNFVIPDKNPNHKLETYSEGFIWNTKYFDPCINLVIFWDLQKSLKFWFISFCELILLGNHWLDFLHEHSNLKLLATRKFLPGKAIGIFLRGNPNTKKQRKNSCLAYLLNQTCISHNVQFWYLSPRSQSKVLHLPKLTQPEFVFGPHFKT